MRTALWAAAWAIVATAACGSSDSHPGVLGSSEGTDSGTTAPPLPTNATIYTLDVGHPVPVAPGTKSGYALTAPQPMSYQFRWTGDDKVAGDGFKDFAGSIWTTGHFTSLTPGCLNNACPLETGDYVSPIIDLGNAQRIDWNTIASDGWDGFSFTTDTEPVLFEVWVDGAQRPDLFLFPEAPGGQPSSPAANPFGIKSTQASMPGDSGSPD